MTTKPPGGQHVSAVRRDTGRAFDSSEAALHLIAVAYSLGLQGGRAGDGQSPSRRGRPDWCGCGRRTAAWPRGGGSSTTTAPIRTATGQLAVAARPRPREYATAMTCTTSERSGRSGVPTDRRDMCPLRCSSSFTSLQLDG